MSDSTLGRAELVETPFQQAGHEARRGSVLQFAVVVAFLSLSVCYAMGVSGNSAILIFAGVILGVVAANGLVVALNTNKALGKERLQIISFDKSIRVERSPQNTPVTVSYGDSVTIEIRIKNDPKATGTIPAA